MNHATVNDKTVVLTIFCLQGGGAERFVLTLAQGFKNLGYEPHIVCFKDHVEYDVPKNIPLHILHYQGYRWIPKSLRNKVFAKVFDGFVRKHISPNPQLVLSNLWPVDSVICHSQLTNRVFVIHSTISQDMKVHNYYNSLADIAKVYWNQRIVGVSKGVIDDFRSIVNTSQSLDYIHNPINKEEINRQSNLANSHEQLGIDSDDYLIHVGSFKEAKNHRHLIQAYAKTDKKIPLVLVGQGKLQADCVQLCDQLNISEKVIFAGFQANPYPFIANARGMILSSIYEGFGIVIAEALSLGVPVISTDCESGPRELLPTDNLVAVNDVQALADKMQDLMDNPSRFSSDFDESLLPETVAKRYLQVVGVSC